MKRLNPHLCNYMEVFDSIRSKKKGRRRQILRNLRRTVSERYSGYVARTDTLHMVQPQIYGKGKKAALRHCYDVETTPLSKLKSDIKKAQAAELAGLCQYCGVDSTPTFDHFLPKEIFPEFSVLAINLIPCCYECNQVKRAKWTNGSHCLVFNLYFDQLPTERVLYCRLNYSTTSIPQVEFYLNEPAGLAAADFQRAKSHYTTLGLLSKFNRCANTFISETRNELRQLAPNSRSVMISLLRGKVSNLVMTFGENYWKVAIAEAMHTSSEFLSSCENP